MPWHRTAAGAHVYVGGVDLSGVTNWAQFGRQPQRLAVLHCEPDPLDELLAAAGIDPEETP